MKHIISLLIGTLFSTLACADSFYVAYEWQKPDGSRIKSWATGFIHEDIDTEKGLKSLIRLLQQENKITSAIVVLYLKKLKPEPNQRPKKKPYIKGQRI